MEPRALGLLSSGDVADLFRGGPVDLVIPLGAVEQHGPHLPLATDTLIADALAERVADNVGECLVAPCLPAGASSHHLGFAGTGSLEPATVATYVVDVASAWLEHGFRCAYLVTGHAGNVDAMGQAAETLRGRYPDRVLSFDDWPAQREAVHRVAVDELSLDADVVGTHAGHFETSIMVLLAPDLVDLDRAEPGYVGPATEASRTLRSEGMAALSEHGVIGDPRGANPEAGARYLQALVDHVTEGIVEHRSAAATAARR